MIVEVEVSGRRRRVSVERRADEWLVAIDGGAPVRATIAEIDGRWSVLIGGGADDGGAQRSYEVSFEAHPTGGAAVLVDGASVPVAIVDPRARDRRGRGDGAAAAGGPRAIVAPMPGRVVRVLVERGQTVAARQGVVVVEAMKMENELRAPRAGTVAAVHVSEGMSVEAHAVLVVLE